MHAFKTACNEKTTFIFGYELDVLGTTFVEEAGTAFNISISRGAVFLKCVWNI